MRILAIDCDYDCDTAPRARILPSIIEQQAAAGRGATVFTAQRASAEACQRPQSGRASACGVDVRRIRLLPERNGWRLLRTVNTAWFLLRALFHATVHRYDIIIAGNHPRVLMGLVLRTVRALRGTPYIYICHDLFPELAVVEGELNHGRFYDWLLRWDASTCSTARRTIVPSRDMAETLAERGVPAKRISVINGSTIAVNPHTRQKLPPPLDDRADTTRFLFVGELGRRQGLERLIAAARLVAARVPCQLIFIGEGSVKSELVELAGDLLGRRIVFMPPQSAHTVVAAMRECDFGIVSLGGDAHRFTYPYEGNLHGLVGCPVIAIVEPQSELAQAIERHDLGYVVASRSVTEIAETILKAVVERRRWTPECRMQLAQRCRLLIGHAAAPRAWDEIFADASRPTVVMSHDGRSSKAA